jgi:hypothetical protein
LVGNDALIWANKVLLYNFFAFREDLFIAFMLQRPQESRHYVLGICEEKKLTARIRV